MKLGHVNDFVTKSGLVLTLKLLSYTIFYLEYSDFDVLVT